MTTANEAKTYKFHPSCDECGSQFQTNCVTAKFCSTECRKTYNNRRAIRGAELYDFMMLRRFGDEAVIGVKGKGSRFYANDCLATADALVSGYHAADIENRQGRRSYNTMIDAKAALKRSAGCPDYNR
ncbi:MAG: hypothetical protein ABWY63_14265 [Hyphomicrobiaceae bacterium]